MLLIGKLITYIILSWSKSISGEAYERFVGNIQVQAQEVPKELKYEFSSDCTQNKTVQFNACQQNAISDTFRCENTHQGDSVQFTISLTLSRCLDKPKQFHIAQVGINQVIEIESYLVAMIKLDYWMLIWSRNW